MLRKIVRRIMVMAVIVFAMTLQFTMTASAAELQGEPKIEESVSNNSVSDNSVSDNSVSDNSAPTQPTEDENQGNNQQEPVEGNDSGSVTEEPVKESIVEEATVAKEAVEEEVVEKEAPVVQQPVDPTALQTTNYQNGILADWQKITEALSTLTPDDLTNTAEDASILVLQLQNVTNIPADIKNGLMTTDGSGRTKMLHCNVGYGTSLVFNGATDNSGFNGVSNASASVTSEKRGKRSMATTVRFASHENLGTVASLQVNLPHCNKGTKVSVYAETIVVDANGNVTVGENVCIGNTKADENGNVEVAIQSTANYMFVYKGAKD